MVKDTHNNSKFANPTYTAWLLEAIAKVKSHKQRPNIERICSVLKQQHSVSTESVCEQLALAVKDGAILKVLNKGLSSYRDPACVTKLQTRHLDVHRKTDLTKYIVRSVKELGEIGGSTLKVIEKYFCNSYNVRLEEGLDLSQLLRKASSKGIKSGHLTQCGRHLRVSFGQEQSDPIRGSGGQGGYPENNINGENNNVRIKKKVSPMPVCSFCLGSKTCNRDGFPEELISCADCGSSGHPSCLMFSPALREKVKTLRWQCIECKVCSFCEKSGKEDDMLFCDACDRAYHMHCCIPSVSKTPKGVWKCNVCDPSRGGRKAKKLLERFAMREGARLAAIAIQNGPKKGRSFKETKDKEVCPTPGCSGRGNANGKSFHHRKPWACPNIPDDQRPPQPKKKKVPTATLR